MSFDAGSVTATLEIDRTPFQRGLDQARADADKFERNPIKTRVDVDTIGAGVRLADWRKLQTASALAIGLDPNFAKADATLAAWRERQNHDPIRPEVDPDTKPAEAKAQHSGNAMMALMAAGITAAAPLVGGALVGSVGAGFVALAAVAQRQNEYIRFSFDQLGADIGHIGDVLTKDTVPALAGALDDLDHEARVVGPQLAAAMGAANPEIATLTSGISSLAGNLVPGLTAALRNGEPVAQGFAALLGQVGATGSDMLVGLSTHSAEFGTVFQSTGSIVRSAGGLITGVANDIGTLWARNAGQMDAAVQGAENTVLGLAQGALPVLSTALGVAAGAVNGITHALEPMSGVLGTVGGVALTAFGGFKLAGLYSAGVKGLSEATLSLGARVEGVAPAAGRLLGNVAALGESAVPVLGAALAAGTVLIGIWTEAQHNAVASSQDYKSATDSLTQSLIQSNGAIGAHTVQTLQTQQAYQDLLPKAQQLGVSQTDLLTAIIQGGPALDGLNNRLGVLGSQTMPHFNEQGQKSGVQLTDSAQAALNLRDGVDKMAASFGSSQTAAGQALAAIMQVAQVPHGALAMLQADIQKIGDTTVSDTDKINAMKDALLQLSGGQLKVEDAQKAVNDSLRLATDQFHQSAGAIGAATAALGPHATAAERAKAAQQDAAAAATGFGNALIDVNGHVNTMTANGSALLGLLQNEQGNFIQLYKSTMDQATAFGASTESARHMAQVAVDQHIPALIGTMTQLGLTKEQAQRLIDTYHLTPPAVQTVVTAPGLLDVTGQVDGLNNRLENMRDKTIHVNAYGQFFETDASGSVRHVMMNAAGGLINGPGTGTSDSILSYVSNGEYIVRAAQTAKYLPLLEAINSGSLPGYATGGMVTVDYPPVFENVGGAAKYWYDHAEANFFNLLRSMLIPPGGATSGVAADAQRYAAGQLGRFGWGPDQMAPLIALWNRESGWNPWAVNPSSGAYGIPQSLGHGHPFNLGDYAGQINWGFDYIAGRYGTPAAAWGHELATGWYDQGGSLAPGYTLAYNGTGEPERIRTAAQEDGLLGELRAIRTALANGRQIVINQDNRGHTWSAEEVAAANSRHMTSVLLELT